jgi:hypothetical protein
MAKTMLELNSLINIKKEWINKAKDSVIKFNKRTIQCFNKAVDVRMMNNFIDSCFVSILFKMCHFLQSYVPIDINQFIIDKCFIMEKLPSNTTIEDELNIFYKASLDISSIIDNLTNLQVNLIMSSIFAAVFCSNYVFACVNIDNETKFMSFCSEYYERPKLTTYINKFVYPLPVTRMRTKNGGPILMQLSIWISRIQSANKEGLLLINNGAMWFPDDDYCEW